MIETVTKCDIGGTIHLRVNTLSEKTEWTFNGQDVYSSECYPQNGFIKRNVSLDDMGKYECKENGILKNAFLVIVKESIGVEHQHLLNIVVGEHHSPMTWTFNDQAVSASIEQSDTGLKKANVDYNDSGKYRLKHKDVLICEFDVIVYESKKLYIGSGFPFGNGAQAGKWVFNNEELNIERNKRIEKKKEFGIYSRKEEGHIVYACNVIMIENIQLLVGSHLQLKCNTSMGMRSDWAFNGKAIFTDGNDITMFEKKKADYSDSGRYECKVGGILKYEVVVLVYGEIQVKLGSDIDLRVNSNTVPQDWQLNGDNVINSGGWTGYTKKNATFEDSGKYMCEVSSKVTHAFKVTVYDYLFKDEFLGIRFPRSYPDKPTENDLFKLEDTKQGIAVILTIQEYDKEDLIDIPTMKSGDNENYLQLCKDLKFEIKECKANHEKNIIEYLENVAKENLEKYDYLMVFVGSHAGYGFICCGDFNKEEATGLIHISRLLDIFLNIQSLRNKPKFFVFECCVQSFPWVCDWKNQPMIKKIPEEKINTFLIETQVTTDTTYRGDENGSFFSQEMKSCVRAYANVLQIRGLLNMVKGGAQIKQDQKAKQ